MHARILSCCRGRTTHRPVGSNGGHARGMFVVCAGKRKTTPYMPNEHTNDRTNSIERTLGWCHTRWRTLHAAGIRATPAKFACSTYVCARTRVGSTHTHTHKHVKAQLQGLAVLSLPNSQRTQSSPPHDHHRRRRRRRRSNACCRGARCVCLPPRTATAWTASTFGRHSSCISDTTATATVRDQSVVAHTLSLIHI